MKQIAYKELLNVAATLLGILTLVFSTLSHSTTIVDTLMVPDSPYHWTVAGSPYVLTKSITVPQSEPYTDQNHSGSWEPGEPYEDYNGDGNYTPFLTLVMDAGSVVKGEQYYSGLVIEGILDAQGTVSDPVVFTSYRDDDYAGDSNADGPSIGQPGDWGCLRFENGDNLLEHCLIRYAGGSDRDTAVYLYRCSPTVSHNVIEDSRDSGVRALGMVAGEISHNTIRNCGDYGIYLADSSPIVSNNTVTGNEKSGLYIASNSIPQLTDNVITANAEYPVHFHSTTIPTITGNVLTGNSYDVIAFDGILEVDCTLSNIQGLGWPYVMPAGLTIEENVTLTIPTGCVVKGEKYYSDLTVKGFLDARGTAGNPVVFTSYRDDDYAGDSNADGPSVGQPGDWGCLRFENGDNLLEHCLIRYAGGSDEDSAVYIYQCSPTISHNVIEDSRDDGVRGLGMVAGEISHNTIRSSGDYGIHLADSSPIVSNNTVTENGKSGLYIATNGVPQVTNNVITANADYPLYFHGTTVPTVTGNQLTGNGYDAIAFDGILEMDCTLSNIQGLGWPYVLPAGLTIEENVTLTIPAGSVVKGEKYYSDITVKGFLAAQGNADDPVVFTSYRDDDYGGDSNADGPSVGQPGDWGCLRFENGDNLLEHCLIRYAGGSDEDSAVYIYQCSPTISRNVIEDSRDDGVRALGMVAGQISHNTIRNCGDYGVYLADSSPTVSENTITANVKGGLYLDTSSPDVIGNCFLNNTLGILVYRAGDPSISDNDFVENTEYGIRNDTTSTVNAQGNWWGDLSGPSGAGPGSGDAVTDYVDYANWVTDPCNRGNVTVISIVQNGRISLTWQGFCSMHYTVLFTDDLAGGVWSPVPGTTWPIAETSWEGDAISGVRSRFYKVMAE